VASEAGIEVLKGGNAVVPCATAGGRYPTAGNIGGGVMTIAR
jgi:hypothetical protein